MSEDTRHRPRAATCEDWDENTQKILPGSRKTAKVVGKKSHPDLRLAMPKDKWPGEYGIGERKKSPTTKSDPSARAKLATIQTNLTFLERDRQPYQMSHVQQKKTQEKDAVVKDSTGGLTIGQVKYFVHEPGLCWSCDTYGKHVEPKDYDKVLKLREPRAMAYKDENSNVPPTRRLSNQDVRPVSMYATYQPPTPFTPSLYTYAPPVLAPQPYLPTPSPMIYNPMPYYTPIPAQIPQYSYFDTTPNYYEPQPIPEGRPVQPVHRQSMYGEVVLQRPRMEKRSTSPEKVSRSSFDQVRSSTVRAELDRAVMPPPPKPKHAQSEVVVTQRPSLKKTATYDTEPVLVRSSRTREEADRRPVMAPPASPQETPRSPTRPPSSYRGPNAGDIKGRPHATRKSVSYTNGATTTTVESSQPHGLARRTTIATTPLERKEAAAEAYQRRRSEMTTEDLTAEALTKLKKTSLSSRSETGSSYSHKSHYSSSRDSSGRERSQTSGTRTSILIDGGLKLDIPANFNNQNGRPLSIILGNGVTISMNNQEQGDGQRDQKLIERPPSAASHRSRVSASGGALVQRERNDDHDRSRQSSRRESETGDHPANTKQFRRPSRGPAGSRPSVDHGRRGSHDADRR